MQVKIALFALAALAAIVTHAAPTDVPKRHIISFETTEHGKSNLVKSTIAKGKVVHNFDKHSVVELAPEDLDALSKIKGIKIYADEPVHAVAVQNNPPNWGIDRIDETNLPLDNKYVYPDQSGANVNVYVLDTGIRTTHTEFSGRAFFGANFHGDGINGDCNGHGTHVASSVMGETVGVAKDARVFDVKVLGCNGFGAFSNVMAGIQYVINQHNASPNKKTIINMSLTGGHFQPVNDMVQAATNAGVTVVVAAGNDNANACNFSPASAPSAITVAASDINDVRAGFSNFGNCVDIYGPGVDIRGASHLADNAFVHFQGTSMASPHVAGVAALYQGTGQALTPVAITNKLIADSLKNKISSNPPTTPNRLLFLLNTTPAPTCAYEIASFDGVKKYCVLEKKTRADSVTACTAINGNLADVQSTAEFGYLASRVQQKSWIRSWQGDSYGGACLLFYPGGAIVTGPCGELNQGLCEINV